MNLYKITLVYPSWGDPYYIVAPDYATAELVFDSFFSGDIRSIELLSGEKHIAISHLGESDK